MAFGTQPYVWLSVQHIQIWWVFGDAAHSDPVGIW